VLEVLECARGAWAEDPVDTPAVESDSAQCRLQLTHVVAAHVRRDQHEQPVADLPGGFDQGAPRLVVAQSGGTETTLVLEVTQRGFGRRAKKTRLGAGGLEPGGAEAALKVAYGLAALTGCQREVARNSSSSCISAPLPLAPTIFFLISPPSNSSSVGMLMTL
jgi:hypothetical protein